MSSWRNREQRVPERMSERLRRDTERKWAEDPYLSSAGGGGYDDCHDHHGWDDGQDDGYGEGEQLV